MTIRPMELVKFQSRCFDKELDFLVQQIENIPTKQRWPCDLWSHPLFWASFTLDLQNHNVVQGDKQLTNVLMIAWPQIKVDHVGVMAFSIGQQPAQQETLNVEVETFKSSKTWVHNVRATLEFAMLAVSSIHRSQISNAKHGCWTDRATCVFPALQLYRKISSKVFLQL